LPEAAARDLKDKSLALGSADHASVNSIVRVMKPGVRIRSEIDRNRRPIGHHAGVGRSPSAIPEQRAKSSEFGDDALCPGPLGKCRPGGAQKRCGFSIATDDRSAVAIWAHQVAQRFTVGGECSRNRRNQKRIEPQGLS
jgi:hypothetical protein